MKKSALLAVAAGSILMLALSFGCKPKESTSQTAEPTKAETGQPAVQPEPAAVPEPEAKPAEEPKVEPQPPAAGAPAEEKKIPADKETLTLKLAKNTMPPVKFPHLKHADELNGECKKCHHMGGEVFACTSCHGAKPGPNNEPTFKNAAHKLCQGCHKEMKKGPTVCTKCHK